MSAKQFKHEIRPGNAAVLVNGQVRGDAAGCPRAILIRDYWGQPKVTDFRSLVTFATGTACETVVFNKLQETYGENIKNDVEMTEAVTEHTGVVGHADFVTRTDKGYVCWEAKSVQSINTFKKVFVNCEPKLNNIAQLLQYMLMSESYRGKLVYTTTLYGQAGKGNSVKAGDQKIFDIMIHDNGRITADQQLLPFTIQDVLAWRLFMAECLENRRLEDPPTPWEIAPWSVCDSCEYTKECRHYNEHRSFEEFENDIKLLLDTRGRR